MIQNLTNDYFFLNGFETTQLATSSPQKKKYIWSVFSMIPQWLLRGTRGFELCLWKDDRFFAGFFTLASPPKNPSMNTLANRKPKTQKQVFSRISLIQIYVGLLLSEYLENVHGKLPVIPYASADRHEPLGQVPSFHLRCGECIGEIDAEKCRANFGVGDVCCRKYNFQ